MLRKSQPVFIYLSIIGAFLMNLSIQAFIGENKSSSCILRPWAIDISSTIMFTPLLMKLHRIDVLFRMSKKLKKIKIPDYKVALQVVGLCCVDLVILILWTTVQVPFQQTWPYSAIGLLQTVIYDACSTTLTIPFECLMIAWKACLLGAGVYKVRTDSHFASHAPPHTLILSHACTYTHVHTHAHAQQTLHSLLIPTRPSSLSTTHLLPHYCCISSLTHAPTQPVPVPPTHRLSAHGITPRTSPR